MAKYTAIADISKQLVQLLQKQLVPELILSPNEVLLCSPQDKGDAVLGIFLYDVQESKEVWQSDMINGRADKQYYPPVYMSLYYMFTAYSSGDLKFRMGQEEKILGKVIQCLQDYGVIPLADIDKERITGVDIQIQQLQMTADEKMKLWNFSGQPFKLSLFYKVAPVAIDSARTKAITRVSQVEVNLGTMKRR